MAWTFDVSRLEPGRPYTVAELVRKFRQDVPTVAAAVRSLVDGGWLVAVDLTAGTGVECWGFRAAVLADHVAPPRPRRRRGTFKQSQDVGRRVFKQIVY